MSIERTGRSGSPDPRRPAPVAKPAVLAHPRPRERLRVHVWRPLDASRSARPRQPHLVSRNVGSREANRHGAREAVHCWMADASRGRRSGVANDESVFRRGRRSQGASGYAPSISSTPSLRVRALTGWQNVSFQGASDHVASVGAEVVLDTRLDPFLARDAVFVRATISRLAFRQTAGIDRTELEGHGYIGLLGQTILVASASMDAADGPRPDYLKPLLGGPLDRARIQNRHRRRRFARRGIARAEGAADLATQLRQGRRQRVPGCRQPCTTMASDSTDQPWRRGVGGSVWFTAAFVRVNVAVAHGIGASTRVQFQGNLTF